MRKKIKMLKFYDISNVIEVSHKDRTAGTTSARLTATESFERHGRHAMLPTMLEPRILGGRPAGKLAGALPSWWPVPGRKIEGR